MARAGLLCPPAASSTCGKRNGSAFRQRAIRPLARGSVRARTANWPRARSGRSSLLRAGTCVCVEEWAWRSPNQACVRVCVEKCYSCRGLVIVCWPIRESLFFLRQT